MSWCKLVPQRGTHGGPPGFTRMTLRHEAIAGLGTLDDCQHSNRFGPTRTQLFRDASRVTSRALS